MIGLRGPEAAARPEIKPCAMRRLRFLAVLPFAFVLLLAPRIHAAESGVIVVPPGNRSAKQPEISVSSVVRTAETNSSFDEKYRRIYDQLAADQDLMGRIKAAAALFGIDPIHIVGAIVGEHTYNVDLLNSLQDASISLRTYLDNKAAAWLGVALRFGNRQTGESIADFVARPQFAKCADSKNDFELWSCRNLVWRTVFQGRTVDGVTYDDGRFQATFFQPKFAGQTFGFGQLSPLAALMVTDLVHEKNPDEPLLDMSNAPEVYNAVMKPDRTLQYVAALLSREMAAYRTIAGFDISQNPGLSATLYNLGDAIERAQTLAAENRRRRALGQGAAYPRENYYGWFVNAHLDELRKLL